MNEAGRQAADDRTRAGESAAAPPLALLVVPPVLPLVGAIAITQAVPGLGEAPLALTGGFLEAPHKQLVHWGDLLTYGAVALLLHLTLCLCAIGALASWILRLAGKQRSLALRALGLALLLVLGLILVSYVWDDDLALILISFKSVCELLVQAELGTGLVDRCFGADNESPLTLLAWLPTFAGMATVVFAIAVAASLVVPPGESDEAAWRAAFQQRSQRLQHLLYGLSAVLVTSTLSIVLFAALPVSLIADETSRAAAASYARGLGAFWGVVFTMTLIAAVLPAALLLFRLAKRHRAILGGAEDYEDWLHSQIYPSARRQLGNAAILLAPLIAGPAGGLLEKAFG